MQVVQKESESVTLAKHGMQNCYMHKICVTLAVYKNKARCVLGNVSHKAMQLTYYFVIRCLTHCYTHFKENNHATELNMRSV